MVVVVYLLLLSTSPSKKYSSKNFHALLEICFPLPLLPYFCLLFNTHPDSRGKSCKEFHIIFVSSFSSCIISILLVKDQYL
ncbi:hypothetical protein C1645_784557, partial [Glomus cerebriforme]